ncbi:hypothetical protein ACFL7D_12140 [candidate division KSB1 bacterium]
MPSEQSNSDFPKKLNIGSGWDIKENFINLDITDRWKADVIADLNEPFPIDGSQVFKTDRFGEIEIKDETFSYITAHDVLEHLRNLSMAMTSCLNILQAGGLMDILVPYDLSHGAWQDPTHVRAFNENSWIYFTSWFWYHGWEKYRFNLERREFTLTEYGGSLQKNGHDLESILRVPRAVDHMKVILQKVRISDKDRKQRDDFFQSVRSGNTT